MISFRYHLVTIVALFLALALGVVIGTSVVAPSVINELESRADRAIETTHRLQADIAELRTELRTWSAFGDEAEPLLTAGALDGHRVVVVTATGVDVADVDAVRRGLREAGAVVTAVLVATERMVLADEQGRAAMAQLLGVPETLPEGALRREAAARLGARLAGGPAPGERDLLDDLVREGFLAGDAPGGDGVREVGGPGQAVVVVSGGSVEPVPSSADFFMPLLVALSRATHPVAVAESAVARFGFVVALRDDPTLDSQVLTVDNADTVPGRVALVLGLADLLDGGTEGCDDFGVKPGACGLLPPPSEDEV